MFFAYRLELVKDTPESFRTANGAKLKAETEKSERALCPADARESRRIKAGKTRGRLGLAFLPGYALVSREYLFRPIYYYSSDDKRLSPPAAFVSAV